MTIGRLHQFILTPLLAILSLTAMDAQAADEVSLAGEDLTIRGHARWAGGHHGGYFPVRLSVYNSGQERELTFRFQPDEDQPAPVVEQTLSVPEQAFVPVTLSIPLVGVGTHGTLKVFERGEELPLEGANVIVLPEANVGGAPAPAVLVIAEGAVSFDRLQEAVQSLSYEPSTGRLRTGHMGTPPQLSATTIAPDLLPRKWIDYSGLDVVAVELKTLEAFDPQEQAALIQWMHCGGTLLIFNVGEPAAKSRRLAELLGLPVDSDPPGGWRPARPEDRTEVPLVEYHGRGVTIRGAPVQRDPRNRDILLPGGENLEAFVWHATGDAFAWREVLLGVVCAFPGDPFAGSRHDWAWLIRSLGEDRFRWIDRHGLSARTGNREFVEFLIPGVKSVPVYSYLVLITVFTLIIGPLNYLLLWKRKRLYLLVLTIPGIALITSLGLFGYSVVAHGFDVKARARSFTILDQRTRTAVTTCRVALYAGLAPGEGLNFSSATAVYPIRPEGQTFESARLDWSEGQALNSGWLPSRTRTQFLTVAHRRERGRLQVGRPDAGTLSAANGFEQGIEAVVVVDGSGRVYYGSNLPAGESARLETAEPAQLRGMAELLRRHPLEPPEELKSRRSRSIFESRVRRVGGRWIREEPIYEVRYSENLAERRLQAIREAFVDQRDEQIVSAVGRNVYLAVFRENPGVNLGVEQADEQAGYHVVLGILE